MGRTKSFEPQQVLHQAIQIFWKNGFEATSVADLEKHLKINKFSLYNTFGNKHALYLQALDLYIKRRFTPLLQILQSPAQPGLPAIKLFFDTLSLVITSQPEKIGCFVTAAGTERSHVDSEVHKRVQWVYGQLEDGFYYCLESALHAGQIRPDTPLQNLARFLLVQSQGMLTVGRNLQDSRTLDGSHGFLQYMLDRFIYDSS